jgi:hypothetical protein
VATKVRKTSRTDKGFGFAISLHLHLETKKGVCKWFATPLFFLIYIYIIRFIRSIRVRFSPIYGMSIAYQRYFGHGEMSVPLHQI